MPSWGAGRSFRFMGALVAGMSLTFPFAASSALATPSASIEGMWLVKEKDGIFRVGPCRGDNSRLCGALVGMKYTEAEPEKDFQGKSECGLEIVSNMVQREGGRWHGRVLDPHNGHRYGATMWLADDNTLKLRGYLGVSLFGETQTWTRLAHPAIGARCRMLETDE